LCGVVVMESVGNKCDRRVRRHNVFACCLLINGGDNVVACWCSLVKGRLLEFEVICWDVDVWRIG
jgi:hypothetical protein